MTDKRKKSKAASAPQGSYMPDRENTLVSEQGSSNNLSPENSTGNYASTQDLLDALEIDRTKSGYPREPEKPFMLRSKNEDILRFLKNQMRIPVSQRKSIIEVLEQILKRKINIKKDDDFYNAFLDFVEAKPSRVAYLAIASKFPNLDDQLITDDQFLRALNSFSPIRLSAKVFSRKIKITDLVDEKGIGGISESDLIGMFFYYGTIYSIPYVSAARKYVEKRKNMETIEKEISVARKKISSALEKNKFSEIINICKKISPSGKKFTRSILEANKAKEKYLKLGKEILADLEATDETLGYDNAPKASGSELESKRNIAKKISADEERNEKNKKRKNSRPAPMLQRAYYTLIKDGYFSIAARFSEALERRGQSLGIPASSLRLASASRISFWTWDSSTQKFADNIELAIQDVTENSVGSAIVAGALLCISVLQPAYFRRATLARLNLGDFEPVIGELLHEISKLDFSFNPDPDELAEALGRTNQPRRLRVEKEIGEWKRIMEQGVHAGIYRKIIGPDGEFGKIIHQILSGSKNVSVDNVQEVIKRFESRDHILARIREERLSSGRKSTERFPLDFTCRRLGAGVDLLQRWLNACEADERKPVENHQVLRLKLEKLNTQIGKSVNLLARMLQSSDLAQAAICTRLLKQVRNLEFVLKGKSIKVYADFEDALYCELNLLPLPGNYEEESEILLEDDEKLIEFVSNNIIPPPNQAIISHGEFGLFRKAARLIRDIDDKSEKAKLTDIIEDQRKRKYSQILSDVSRLLSQLREVGKFDVKRYEKIRERIGELEQFKEDIELERECSLEMLGNFVNSDMSGDAYHISNVLSEIEVLIKESRVDIRTDQRSRLKQLQRESGRDAEIERLLKDLDKKQLDHVEDQIAHIRDGRAIEPVITGVTGPFDSFFPDFVASAEKGDWPKGYEEFVNAFQSDGRLQVSGDRYEASKQILRNWFELDAAVSASQSTTKPLNELLRDLAFENVNPQRGVQIQTHRAWTHDVEMEVPYSDVRSWLIPPKFGSLSRGNYLVVVMHPTVLMEQIRSSLRARFPTIVIVTGKIGVEGRKDIAREFRKKDVPALVLDETLLTFIATHKDDRLKVLFDCGLPFGRVQPYFTAPGKIPPEMFFGREQEISKIISDNAEGILIYGGRQLGKSALLAQVEELYHDRDKQIIVIREDIKQYGGTVTSADEIWITMADRLRDFGVVTTASNRRSAVVSDIRSWISENPRGRVLCLFDEADEFLAYEAKNDFPNLMHLKGLMENTNRAFKTVFAGLHQVQRMFRASNSPLAHLGTEICVGPLNRTRKDLEAARRLAEMPMRAAGFRFGSVDAPYEILSYVNHYPSLMQVYGQQLIEHLHSSDIETDGPLWKIPDEMLFQGEGFKNIESEIRDKFRLTLNLDGRYRVIAHVLGLLKWNDREAEVMRDGLTAQQIKFETSEYWPIKFDHVLLDDMQIILDEMFELGILGKIEHYGKSTTYCLRTNQVANMLGTEFEIIEELDKLKKIKPSKTYNPFTHRRFLRGVSDPSSIRDARNISPLTDSQLQRIFQVDGAAAGIQFIVGTRLLGLNHVNAAIEKYSKTFEIGSEQTMIDVQLARSQREYAELIRSEPRDKFQLKVVICSQKISVSNNLIDFTENQSPVLAGTVRPILVLDALQPELRELAIRRGAISLRPWGEEMLRTYLQQVEMPVSDDLWEVVLLKTGGVPDYVVKALVEIRESSESYIRAAENLDTFQAEGIIEDNDTFVKALDEISQAQSMLDEKGAIVSQIYDLVDQEIRLKTSVDFEAVGYDLLALGALDIFEPKGKFRITYLGRLLIKSTLNNSPEPLHIDDSP